VPDAADGAASRDALLRPRSANAIAEGLRAVREPEVADRLRGAGPLRAGAYGSARMGAVAWAAIRGAAGPQR